MGEKGRSRKNHPFTKRIAAILLVCVFVFTAIPALALDGDSPEAGDDAQGTNQEAGFLAEELEGGEGQPPSQDGVPETQADTMGDGPAIQGTAGSFSSDLHTFTWQEAMQGMEDVTLEGNSLKYEMQQRYNDAQVSEGGASWRGTYTATAMLRFSVGSASGLPAGAVEIRIPQYVVADDDGNPVGSFELWLAHEDDPDKLDYSYHYRVDDSTREIVITNHMAISGSDVFSLPVAYSFDTREVPHGFESDDLYATFTVTVGQEQESYDSSADPLTLSLTHELGINSFSKDLVGTYYIWNSSWGAKPSNADAYYYVAWRLSEKHSATRRFTYNYTELVNGGAVPGEFVGASALLTNVSNNQGMPRIETWNADELVYERWGYCEGTSLFVLTRYPKSQVDSGTTVTNKAQLFLQEDGAQGRTTEVKEASRTATFIYDSLYPGDLCVITKAAVNANDIDGERGSTTNTTGRTNKLLAGDDLIFGFTIGTSSRMKNLTNNGDNKATIEIVDNKVEFGVSPLVQLDVGDYEMSHLLISEFSEYDGESTETGYNEVLADYAEFSEIIVEYQTGLGGEWLEAGRVKRTGTNQYGYEYTNSITGAVTSGVTGLWLPEGAVGIRLLHTSSRYKVDIDARVGVTLHPSETVLDLIKEAPGSASHIYNYTTMRYDPNVGYEPEKSAFYRLNQCTPTSSIQSTVTNVEYNQSGRYALVSNRAKMYEHVDTGNHPELKDQFGDYTQTEGTFYALLPKGAVLEPDSVIAGVTQGTGTGMGEVVSHTLEQVENWQGSGQTMIIVQIAANGVDTWYVTNGIGCSTGFVVTFDYYYSFESADLYGMTLEHDVAYRTATGTLVEGGPASEGYLYQPGYFEALNQEGNKDDTNRDTNYYKHATTLTILTPMEYGFDKRVKATDSVSYVISGEEVAAGNTYSYRLSLKTWEQTTASNVVMYDVLEKDGAWRGELIGMDITHPVGKGIAVKVYYSTQTGLDPENSAQMDVANSAIWSETQPANLADVTAIAFDLGTGTNGAPYVFQAKESVAVYITMRAPENFEDYSGTDLAVNRAYMSGTIPPAGDVIIDQTQKSSITEIALRGPDVEVEKTADPASGTAADPAPALQGSVLEYTVSVANTNAGEAIEAVVVEDLLPNGLDCDVADIQYYFGPNASAAQPVQGAARVGASAAGQKLTLTVDKLAAGERISFVIPCTVTGKAGTKLSNTAVVTEFNGKSWELESETTYHIIERGPATKQLVDVNGKGADKYTTVNKGDEITYSINYSAPEGTTKVTITDTLPEGTVFKDATPAGTLSGNGRQYTWVIDIDDTNYWGSVEITLEIEEIPANATHISNEAVVTYEGGENPPGPEQPGTETPVGPTKEVGAINDGTNIEGVKVYLEDEITYRITYSYPEGTAKVIIEDTLPEGVRVEDARPNGTEGAKSYVWEIVVGSEADKGYVEITVAVDKLAAGTTTLVNTAKITYVDGEGNETDDPEEPTVVTPVLVPKAPEVEKRVENSPMMVGERATFTITVTNPNEVVLKNITVTDLLPRELVYVDTDGSYDDTTHRVTWTIERLGAGESVSFYVAVTADSVGTYINIAIAEAPGTEGGTSLEDIDPDRPDTSGPNVDDEDVEFVPGSVKEISKQIFDGSDFVDQYTVKDPSEVLTYRVSVALPDDLAGYTSLRIEDLLPEELKLATGSPAADIRASVRGESTALTGTAGYDDALRIAYYSLSDFTGLAGKTIDVEFDTKLADEGYTGPIENTGRAIVNKEPGDVDYPEPGTDPENPDKETPGPDVDVEPKPEPDPEPVKEISKQIFDGSDFVDQYTVKDPSEVLTYRVSVALPDDLAGYTSLRIEDLLPEELKLATGAPAADIRASVRGESTALTGTAGYDAALRIAYYSLSDFTGLAGKTIDVEFDTKLADESYTGPIENTGRAIVNKEPGDVDYPDPGTDPENPDKETPGPDVDVEPKPEPEPEPVKEISKQIFDGEGYVDKYTVKDPSEVLTYRVSVALPDDLAGYTSLRIEDLLPEELKLATGSPAADIRASVWGESTALTGTAGYDAALRIAYYSLSDFTGLAGKTIDVEFDTKLADESYTGPIENTGRAIVNKEPGDVDYPDPGTDPENPDKETPGPDVDVEPKPEPEPAPTKTALEVNGKEIGPGTAVREGDEVSYRITYGVPEGTVRVIVEDLLPEGVSVVGAKPLGTLNEAKDVYSWDITVGSAEDVGYVEITLQVDTIPENTAELVNRARVKYVDESGKETPDPKEPEVKIPYEPEPEPKPETSKTITGVNGEAVRPAATVQAGDEISYRITYNAPEGTKTIRIEDILPAGVSVKASDPAGKRIEDSYVWEIAAGSPRDKGYVEITLQVESIPAGVNTLVNRAKVSYIDGEGKEKPDPEEPEVEIPYAPTKAALAMDGKAVDSDTKVKEGDRVSYRITYGVPEGTVRVIIEDILPLGVSVVEAEPSGALNEAGSIYTWEIAAGSAEDKGYVEITLEVDKIPVNGDKLENRARVRYVDGEGNETPDPEEPEVKIPYEPDPDPSTSQPSGEDSTTSKPGDGDSTTSKPGGGDSTTSKPGGEDSTTSKPGGGDSTTSKPGGEDSTTSKPGGEDSTTSKPGGGEDSTTSKPGGGDSTTSKPGGGDSTTSKPGGGGSTTSKPNGGGSTTSKPSTSGPSTSEQGSVSEPDPGPGPGPEPTTSRTTSRPVVVTPTTSRTSSTGASSDPGSSSSRPGSTGSSSSSGSGSSSTPDGSGPNGGGDGNGPDGDGSGPNGGDPSSRGGLFSAGGGLGDNPTVQELIDETGSIDLFGNQTPLGSFALRGGWSLVSLLLSILSLLSAVVMFVRLLRNKKQKPEQEYDEDGEPIVQYNEDGEPEEEEQRYKTRRLRMFLATLSGVLPLLLFLILENLRSPMVLLTRWTPLIFVVTLLHFALVIIQMVRRKADEEDEEQDEDIATV